MNVLDTFSLKGKVALVTGGAGIYRRQIVAALAESEAETYIASRGIEALEKVANEKRNARHKVTALKLDLSSNESIQQVHDEIIKRSGRLDILVNNAVTRNACDGWDQPLEKFDMSLHINASALFKITQLFAEDMKNSEAVQLSISAQ